MTLPSSRVAGLISWLVLLVPLAMPSPAPAAVFSPHSRVTEVTVYRDGALVTREAHLTLPAGDHPIKLTEIPAVADPDSVRVTGTGTGGMSIGGVEVSQEFRQPNLTPEYKALDDDDTAPGYVADPNEPGIMTWKITVPKGARKEVVLRYRIRAPRAMPLMGFQ